MQNIKIKKMIVFPIVLAVLMSASAASYFAMAFSSAPIPQTQEPAQKTDLIKWIDLNVPSEMLEKVLNKSLALKDSNTPLDFFEALAYISTKNANNFNLKKDAKTLDELIKKVENGETIASMYGENKYYNYYLESYKAVYGGIIGSFHEPATNETKYGVKGYFPLAQGFWYSHYDDFGNSRSFGFKRKHLGHDLQGSTGTPIIAVESGTVTELGWNRYGGWRIGIRSKDTKRYYYYAHLRKDKPYPADIKLGDEITAGQVIGFLGNTGYSSKENVNMKTCKPHLHFGLQIIFDKSQEKGSKEIWVDVYQICRFLSKHRAKVVKNEETKEFMSTTLKQVY